MKPVYQTTHGAGIGNCMAACIASILECDVESVPNFCARWHYWQAAMNDWLRGYFGLSLVTISWPPSEMLTAFPRGGYVILSGKSPRFDCSHAVVGRIRLEDGQAVVVHDPHPSGDGLETIKECDYFVQLWPGHMRTPCTLPDPEQWQPGEAFRLRKAVGE